MTKFLNDLEQAVHDRFRAVNTDAEIETAAKLAKTIAEAQKATVDAENQLRQLKMESLKSWSVLLVPIVSMMTLLATVIVQAVQIHQQSIDSTRKAEDGEWRELVSSVRGATKDYATDITVSSRLRIFLTSDRYREQARDLAVRVLGNLTNVGTFKELFDAALPSSSSDGLLRAAQVGRSLTANKASIESQCVNAALKAKFRPESPYGLCSFALDAAGFNEFAKASDDFNSAFQNRVALYGVTQQLELLSERIATLLKQSAKTGSSMIDMSGIFFQSANFSELDFSSVNFRFSSLASARLDGAIIATSPGYAPDFGDSEWWNASMIDGEILMFLIDNKYPYQAGWQWYYPSGKIEDGDYRKKIVALCAKAKITCPAIRFGPAAGVPIPPNSAASPQVLSDPSVRLDTPDSRPQR